MDRQLSPEEIRDLLAAYSLDAVDDDERAAVDAYLARVPEARDEVAELQSAASMLAHVGGPPPAGVWERLEALIAETPTPARAVPPIGRLGTPRREPDAWQHGRWQWLAAAAAVGRARVRAVCGSPNAAVIPPDPTTPLRSHDRRRRSRVPAMPS